MGRKSRLKKQYSAQAKKAMRQLIEDSSPEPYGKNNGKKSTVQYYNPLKRLMKGKPYVSEDGKEITKDMAEKYLNFLKKKIQELNSLISSSAATISFPFSIISI